MTKENKKGFTLVELIIVIAIIAVLSVVSVVGYNTFIERANLSADQSEMKNMNNLIELHMIENNKREMDIHGVIKLLVDDNGFSLKSKSKNYTYWFDRAANKIVLAETDEILNKENLSLSINNFQRDDIGAIAANEKYLMIDQSSKELPSKINKLRNLADEVNSSLELVTKYEEIVNSLNSTVSLRLSTHDPKTTLYVGENKMISASLNEVNSIVFKSGIKTIPTNNSNVTSIQLSKLTIPSTVMFVAQNALSALSDQTNLYLLNNNVTFMQGSLPAAVSQRARVTETDLADLDTLPIDWNYTETGTKVQLGPDFWYLTPVPTINLNKTAYNVYFTGKQVSNHYYVNGFVFNQSGKLISANVNSGFIADVYVNKVTKHLGLDPNYSGYIDEYFYPEKYSQYDIYNPLVNIITGEIIDGYDQSKLGVYLAFNYNESIIYLRIDQNEIIYLNSNFEQLSSSQVAEISESFELVSTQSGYRLSVYNAMHPNKIVLKYNNQVVLEKKI